MNESCRASRRWQAGYSLPEMLVVVAIVGLLALVTIPSFVSYYQSQRVKSAMRNFTTDLRKMRALSANRGVQAKLSFATGAGARTYRLFYGSAAVGTTQTWTAIGNGGFSTKSLESIVFFPANATATPQTFSDVDGDGTLDIIFLPSGAVVIGLTTVPLRNEPGAFLGFLALFTDLTPIRGLEARVQEMQTLAQLGEISAGIAHELRNSVSTILGYMKLARRAGIDETADGRLQSAEKEAALLLQAVERLLAFARPIPLNTEEVDLRSLADDQVRQLGDIAEDVHLGVSGPAVTIEGDRVLLSRAIENLLRNAVDAVRENGGGSVSVAIGDTPPSITITDTGIGFDPAETQRLFLPFHSNKPNGFGMGLPLARKIILLHGGTLRLQGEPGKGAVAFVVFSREPVSSEGERRAGSGERT